MTIKEIREFLALQKKFFNGDSFILITEKIEQSKDYQRLQELTPKFQKLAKQLRWEYPVKSS